MEIKEPSETVVIKYSSYTPAQKKATQKYRENNKEKVNEQRKKYYQSRKEKDPKFLEYKRTKAKEYYMKKKLINSIRITPSPVESETIIINNPPEESKDIKKPDSKGLGEIAGSDAEPVANSSELKESQLSLESSEPPKDIEPVKKSKKEKKTKVVKIEEPEKAEKKKSPKKK